MISALEEHGNTYIQAGMHICMRPVRTSIVHNVHTEIEKSEPEPRKRKQTKTATRDWRERETLSKKIRF
jgi:hypothetical protein